MGETLLLLPSSLSVTERQVCLDAMPGTRMASEAERELGVPERAPQSAAGKAQSTAVARATARICNAAGGVLGCQGGHDRFPLSLSVV